MDLERDGDWGRTAREQSGSPQSSLGDSRRGAISCRSGTRLDARSENPPRNVGASAANGSGVSSRVVERAAGAAVGVIARCLGLSRAAALPETLRARLSVAMICDQIESRTAPARRFRREKLLAALLIMCNAAENFLPTELNLANDARLARQKANDVARCAGRRKDSLPGSSRQSNRPLRLGGRRALLL